MSIFAIAIPSHVYGFMYIILSLQIDELINKKNFLMRALIVIIVIATIMKIIITILTVYN